MYSNPDNDPNGPYVLQPAWASGMKRGPVYSIMLDGIFFDNRMWLYSKETLNKFYKSGSLSIKGIHQDGKPNVYVKVYLKDTKGIIPDTIWVDASNTGDAVSEIKSIFSNKIPFDTPKPLRYITKCIMIGTEKNDIILDFFSGSATTAHAIMGLNAEDGGHRKFIMVQLPEICDEKSEAYKAGYKNICEIGKERIRRAGEQIKTEWEKEHPSDTLFSNEEKFTTDIGFKVFKLDSTNIRPWNSESEMNSDDLFSLSDVFKQDRSKEDILYEIMLKYGIFDMPAEEIEINEKTMYRVGKRYMIVCLEDEITPEDVKAIAELSPRSVVFKESGFKNDNDKINAEYNLEKADVEDVKCI